MTLERDLGWLDFNGRVLQEAQDEGVPILERLKFLGIFSSNLDEFFRVRVGAVRRAIQKEKGKKRQAAKHLLAAIESVVVSHQSSFDRTLEEVLRTMRHNGISLVNETELTATESEIVRHYFRERVRPLLIPIMLDQMSKEPDLAGNVIYMAIEMTKKDAQHPHHAILEVPTDAVSRFFVLPTTGETRIILLEDIVRHCLKEVFYLLHYDHFAAYTVKITRDAELDIDDDITESLIDKIEKSVHLRKHGDPVRLIYEETLPNAFLKKLTKLLAIPKTTTILGVKRRYHNFKDFIRFPKIEQPKLYYKALPPLAHPDLSHTHKSMFKCIREKDILLQYPYQRFMPFIDFLREAAIDPKVTQIHITMYRVASPSYVVNALINALKNGKSVFAVIELKARFDEEANIHWSKELSEAGAKVVFGVPGLKVHAKLCVVTRKEGAHQRYYANVSTGNYNENTATLYSDVSLFTVHTGITQDIMRLFRFFENPAKAGPFRHLVVSPFSMRKRMAKYIHQETLNAKKGLPARIIVKANALVDDRMNGLLTAAIKAGVQVDFLIRGPFGIPFSETPPCVHGVSILDRFLEHARLIYFENGGQPHLFISSGDWLYRSFERRIEVACPIYNPTLRKTLIAMLEDQLSDHRKGRNILHYPCTPPQVKSGDSFQERHYVKMARKQHER